MTDQELLQQAKDQVAKDLSLDGWKHFIERFDDDDYKKRGRGVNVIISAAYERAALLAIQSAREEARNGYFRDGYALGYECGNTDGACGTSHANKIPTDKEIDDYLQEN